VKPFMRDDDTTPVAESESLPAESIMPPSPVAVERPQGPRKVNPRLCVCLRTRDNGEPCGHVWLKKKGGRRRPAICPKCKSEVWDRVSKPRKRRLATPPAPADPPA
jgi:hypothetical protein